MKFLVYTALFFTVQIENAAHGDLVHSIAKQAGIDRKDFDEVQPSGDNELLSLKLDDFLSSKHNDEGMNAHDVAMYLHRQLQYDNEFDHVCTQLRTIFNEQCSCGDFDSPAMVSNTVECDYSDVHAIALFDDNPYQVQKMNKLKVCKRNPVRGRSDTHVCTTIQYSNNMAVYCEVSIGGDDHKCQSCELCTTERALLGLIIDCNNIEQQISTEQCTAATQILELSAGTTTSTATLTNTMMMMTMVYVLFFV